MTIVPVAQVVYNDYTRLFPFPHHLIRKEMSGYTRLSLCRTHSVVQVWPDYMGHAHTIIA